MRWKRVFIAMAIAGTGCKTSIEDPNFEVIGTSRAGLGKSVTQTLTPGQCTTTISLDTTPAGLSAMCASKCFNAQSVTLKVHLQQMEGTSWRDVAMNDTGFAAKLGGSTTAPWANAAPGSYRGHCTIDFADTNQNHSTADLFTDSMERARTSPPP